MTRPYRIALHALLSVLCLVGTTAARADVVRLEVGARTFGQGWMFLDLDGRCKVVTAAHVVRGLDGHVIPPVVFDERARQMPAGAPLVLSEEADIAVLPVPSADGPALCGAGRLSAIGVERRVRDMAGAFISTTGESETRDVPVMHRASARDSAGGEMFAVRPTIGSDLVAKGWSGSVVRDSEGPLGVVVEVDPENNEALAVRVDVVRRLMETAPAVPAHAAAAGNTRSPALMALAGTTVDPANGPNQVAGPAQAGWRVEPVRRTVVFTAAFAAPMQIRQVALGTAAGSANQIEAVDVATQAAGGNEEEWTSANYCRALPADATALTCAFLARTVVRVRLVVKTRTDAQILLSGFSMN